MMHDVWGVVRQERLVGTEWIGKESGYGIPKQYVRMYQAQIKHVLSESHHPI